MRIVGVSMVKDESDVIEFIVRNLFDQGVDALLIADNLSSDSTPEKLASLSEEFPIDVVEDKEIGYYQSRKMTDLATVAFQQMGADLVIPFDADEFWTGRKCSLRESLEGAGADIISFPLYNFFPTSSDPSSVDPFSRILNRDTTRAPLYKVAVRNIPGLQIMQGNHSAKGCGTYEVSTTAMIGHFPWRSFAQFHRKVRNGYEAYLATSLPETEGSHWRMYGGLLNDHGVDALRKYYEEWFFDPPMPLEFAPIRDER